MKRWLLLLLAACGEPPDAVGVSLQLPQAVSDIRSFEVFVAAERTLGVTGAEACSQFFADTLPNFTSVASAQYSFDPSASGTRNLSVPPGGGYVVFVQGWNVDITAGDDPAKRVVALGCVSGVSVVAKRNTDFEVKVCLLRPPMDPLCPQ